MLRRKEYGIPDIKDKLAKSILKGANFTVSLFVILCLCTAGLYSVYALWDNSRIYSAAENVQADMIKIKPEAEEDGSASFEELMAINLDVCAWVTLDNTRIDYPVLQGSTNLTYINRDVYGKFALAGSIFLDTRNARDFSDAYSLLYGHHMENGGMFGDLDLYKDQIFFEENTTGKLILPDKTYNLEIFACLMADAGESAIFDPEQHKSDISAVLTYARDNGIHVRGEVIDTIEQMSEPKILAMSTCSTEFTDARTIVLAVMMP